MTGQGDARRHLALVPVGGTTRRAGGRVLAPRSPLARRAGIEPVEVPDDLWVSPRLLAAHSPRAAARAGLRVVA